jgi:hypothetical protein
VKETICHAINVVVLNANVFGKTVCVFIVKNVVNPSSQFNSVIVVLTVTLKKRQASVPHVKKHVIQNGKRVLRVNKHVKYQKN